jgi:ATP/maltotriose-dependent transcriptional regulator MalT
LNYRTIINILYNDECLGSARRKGVSDILLTTKLHIPLVRSELVSRTRLLDRMNEGVKGNLTLISAPAGFGKTTLLGEWIGSLGKLVAWLSLEKEDNDPSRFWTYVLAAIRTIQPDLGKYSFELQFTSPQSPVDAILTLLINEIAALPDPLLLILDDYHVIDSPPIQEGMVFLLDHMPAQLHLVVASRADPAWPLAHWRSRGQLVEIRAADLRFRPEEAADFLKRTMKLDLSVQDITALEERTEGWIAGLQMAALSLQGQEDVQGFINAFTGSNRYIFDYLMEEVLGRQPAEVQEFLLKTSILARLSVPLCDAVLGRTDSRDILYKLGQANLFLIPLDDERQWYRYHHLFAELLGRCLEQTEPDHIAGLHQRASRWYAENNLLSEAIHHALKARDFLLVNELVSGNALSIVEHTELLDVLSHFEEIPNQEISSKPWLCVAYAWVKAYADPTAGLDLILQQAELCLTVVENASERQRLTSHLAAIRAYVAWVKGEADKALELARKALENLPEDDWVTRCHVLNTKGLALQYLGYLTEAIQAIEAVIVAGQKSGRPQDIFSANGSLAFVNLLQGRLRRAFSLCQDMLSSSQGSGQVSRHNPYLANVYARMSMVQLEWNEIKAAILSAREGVALAEQWKQADSLHFTLTCLSKALCAAGSIEEAFAVNDRAMRLAVNVSPWFFRLSVCNDAWLNLAKGDVRAAARRLEEIEPQIKEIDKKGTFLMTKVSLLNAQGNYPEVLTALEEPISELEQRGEYWTLEDLMLFQALALQALGREEEALRAIACCLAFAAPEGYIRIFVEKGVPMVRLLKVAMSRGIETEYIKSLLPAFSTPSGPREFIRPVLRGVISQKDMGHGDQDFQLPVEEFVEPISEREMEILHLLESSLSTPEIAAQLYISVGTVRTHIKNIYRKLDVNRRMEAVQRARELGLI